MTFLEILFGLDGDLVAPSFSDPLYIIFLKQESRQTSKKHEKNVQSTLKSIEEFQYAAIAAADALRADLDQLKTENATLQTRLVESIQEATEAQVELAAIKMAKVPWLLFNPF